MRGAVLVRAWLALAGSIFVASCGPRIATPADASQAVRDSFAWMGDAELCPADVMPAAMRENALAEQSCADDALPACFKRCRKGDVDSCYWLAHVLEQSKADDPAAQALYQRACTLGEPSGCTNRAARLFAEKAKDPGVQRCAARTFARTCDLGDAWGCAMRGNALHEGLGVERDDGSALEALQKACKPDGSSADACGAAKALGDTIRESRATASSAPGGP
jgi:TPR repeat protein